MVVQEESGSCTGRGFADVDANGLLAKFKDWVVKTPVNGGPGTVQNAPTTGTNVVVELNTGESISDTLVEDMDGDFTLMCWFR